MKNLRSETVLSKFIFNWNYFQDATQLQVQAKCKSSWNSTVLSGTYKAVGGFGDNVIYEKQSMDLNHNYWFFFYDAKKNGWNFSYRNDRIVPGLTLLRKTVSPFGKSGQSTKNLNDFKNLLQFMIYYIHIPFIKHFW